MIGKQLKLENIFYHFTAVRVLKWNTDTDLNFQFLLKIFSIKSTDIFEILFALDAC